MNNIAVLKRSQMVDVFPFRTPIRVVINNPNTTGKAVKRITTLRSTGFRPAHIRSKVHPVINEEPIMQLPKAHQQQFQASMQFLSKTFVFFAHS